MAQTISANWAMIFAGGLSALAALLHFGVIITEPDWYRLFGGRLWRTTLRT